MDHFVARKQAEWRVEGSIFGQPEGLESSELLHSSKNRRFLPQTFSKNACVGFQKDRVVSRKASKRRDVNYQKNVFGVRFSKSGNYTSFNMI